MTIAAFKKITLFGLATEKQSLLKALQLTGCLHIQPSRHKIPESLTTSSTTLTDRIRKALLYLRNSKMQGPQKIFMNHFDADEIVNKILDNQKKLRNAIDRRDFLSERIHSLKEWGNFHLPEREKIGNVRLWFYKIQLRDIRKIPDTLVIHEVHRNASFSWLVVIASDEPAENILPESRIHAGEIPLVELQCELHEIREKIDDLVEMRQHLTRYRLLLTRKLSSFMDRTALRQANQCVDDMSQFFSLQGWIPVSQLHTMKAFCKEHQLGLIIEEAGVNETPPTLLKTKPWARGGMQLVQFYQLPAYDTLDPSLVVFFSFSLFFAMILADAGYAMVITLLTILCWRVLGRSPMGRQFRPLLATISIFSLAYGIMLGSYFGIEPHTGLLARARLFSINDFHTMMMVALAVGCLHIMASHLMHAIFARTLSEKCHSGGFVILILGSVLLALSQIHAIKGSLYLSIGLLLIGTLLIMIFASDQPVTSVKSFLLRLGAGFASLTHLPALFGDILSYLRLFALGLAGASLALTFNHMATQIAHAYPGYGWLLALPVLLFGQGLNFLLCLMSAVIHGLRLNYIEFFKWSIKKEGYAYSPFKKKESINE